MIDPETQRQLFVEAVDLLGGQGETARALGVNERHVRYLLAGKRQLHAGLLVDLGRALLDHAERCRKLERRLSPAFAGNLTDRQREDRPHNWRKDFTPKTAED